MLHVALVEDDDRQAERLAAYCETFGKEGGEALVPVRFCDAESFLAAPSDRFDLVLMDIMLPGMNGMDAARELRRRGSEVVLVFITTMAQFAVSGYEVQALDFVLKPVTYPHFQMKMRRAVSVAKQKMGVPIIVDKGKEMQKLSSATLSYAEVRGHELLLHTETEVVQSWESLSSLEKTLADQHFLRCNNCYLVNPKYIRKVDGSTVLMHDGSRLEISRPRKKAFMQALTAYLGEGNV